MIANGANVGSPIAPTRGLISWASAVLGSPELGFDPGSLSPFLEPFSTAKLCKFVSKLDFQHSVHQALFCGGEKAKPLVNSSQQAQTLESHSEMKEKNPVHI